MNIRDYDETLFCLHRMACDELIHVMHETEDDFLAKKIEKFVSAFMLDPDFSAVEKKHYALLEYLDHVFVSQIERKQSLL